MAQPPLPLLPLLMLLPLLRRLTPAVVPQRLSPFIVAAWEPLAPQHARPTRAACLARWRLESVAEAIFQRLAEDQAAHLERRSVRGTDAVRRGVAQRRAKRERTPSGREGE